MRLDDTLQRAVNHWHDAQEQQLYSPCSACGKSAGQIDSLSARNDVLAHLAPKATQTLLEATLGLPWVDASGAPLPFQGVPHRGVSIPSSGETERGLLDGLNEAVDHQYTERTTYWTQAELISLLQQAEALGYAHRSEAGWNWRFLCADCQYDKLRRPSNVGRPKPPRDSVPPRVRFQVLQRDGFRCTYCGKSQRDGAILHVDHVVPVIDGGSSEEGNLVTACDQCNLGKGRMPLP